MASYEIVFITRQDLSAEDVDALTEKFSKIITDYSGKIIAKEYWGLKNLAYKIKKNSRGHYVLLYVDANYDAISELRRVIGFNEDVVRSKIFKAKDEYKISSLKVAESAANFKAGKLFKFEPSALDNEIDEIVINF